MNPLYMMLFLSIFAAIMSLVGAKLKKDRAGSEKYQNLLAQFHQAVTAMLEPGEIVEASCGYNPCAAVTNQRLLISTKNGIDSIPFYQISKLKGMDTLGNKTDVPSRMMFLEIKAGHKYTLANHSEGFEQTVQLLQGHVQG